MPEIVRNAKDLNVTLVQPDLAWEDKETNLRKLEDKIRALGPQAEVVILPEMFSTGFSMRPELLAETMDGPTVAWMKKLSAEKRVILTGSLIIREEEAYFNRLLWVLPDGTIGTYDKKHLFAYAGEHEHYSPGQKRLIASAKGWKINLQVCYDLRFPVWARQQQETGAEYDLLIYVANWPAKRSTAWKTLLRARAIENQCFVVGVNRVGVDGNGIEHSGDSLVIDPVGEILYEKTATEDVFSIDLDRSVLDEWRKRLPFLGDADDFMLLG